MNRTHAGTWTIGILLFFNTVLVVLFQILLSKNMSTVNQMITGARRAAILILLACLLFGLSGRIGAVGAVVLVLAGGIILAFAEMLQSASAWGMSYELAPIEVQGQYLGVFAMSMALQSMLGPGMCSFLVIRFRIVGWLIIGLVIGIASIALGPATRVAVRSIADMNQPHEGQAA